MQTTWPNTKIDHFRPCLAKKKLKSTPLEINFELGAGESYQAS